MYSSIAEQDRIKIIENCYWPLVNLCEESKIPTGIEFSGITLELLLNLAPTLVEKIKKLVNLGLVEIIGSGYSQVIAPLVPAPALVNEQAYSSGLIEHYIKTGYQAIVMEWNNPYSNHKEWDKNWRYYPQRAMNQSGQSMLVIWNNCIAFQKFQRYAHGDIELDQYIQYLTSNVGDEDRFFSLYCNDAEIFDFRPGRYMTELNIHTDGEWNRISQLFNQILSVKNFNLVLPSDVLQKSINLNADNVLSLESASIPIPVKKQDKYNITRWAVSGRNDADINARCYKIYNYLRQKNSVDTEYWRKLCWLWSSDFRTHIEEGRWNQFNEELDKTANIFTPKVENAKYIPVEDNSARLSRNKFRLEFENDFIKLIMNARKGLAIEKIIYKQISEEPLFGTIEHGYFDDISYAADFFSAGTIIEPLGSSKITDLEIIFPTANQIKINGINYYSIQADIKTRLGRIKKEIRISSEEPMIELIYDFDLTIDQPCSIRSGIITVIPTSFDISSLYYKTNNGGGAETFKINRSEINHHNLTNSLITSSHCSGATEQWMEIGDKNKFIKIYSDKSEGYNAPMIQFNNVDDLYLFRLYHSLQEVDDTYKQRDVFKKRFGLRIEAGKNSL
ncbi:glycoside hydrolase family 57 [Candidatus Falkowbacteria bacterium]|nr:glycoside hydrolase family 57 [Candidatus Falkowbacteria bacterium]